MNKAAATFSQTYLRPTEVVANSIRFRRRLFAYHKESLFTQAVQIVSAIQKVTRTHIEYYRSVTGSYHPNLKDFFENSELRDILDSVTSIANVLSTTDPHVWYTATI